MKQDQNRESEKERHKVPGGLGEADKECKNHKHQQTGGWGAETFKHSESV